MTTTELFSSFNEVANKFAEIISSFNESDLNKIPAEGSWTAAQVAIHVTKSNNGIYQSLITEGKITARAADMKVEGMEKMFLNFEHKMQSPEFILPEAGYYKKEMIVSDLKKSIEAIKQLELTININEEIMHFIFQDITKLELIAFLKVHMQRHTHQLEGISRFLELAN